MHKGKSITVIDPIPELVDMLQPRTASFSLNILVFFQGIYIINYVFIQDTRLILTTNTTIKLNL